MQGRSLSQLSTPVSARRLFRLMNDSERFEAVTDAFSHAERAVIITHDNPDPDALASAAGLRVLIEKGCGIPVVNSFGGIVGRAENRSLMDSIGVDFERIEAVEFLPGDAAALVDTQPGAGNNPVPGNAHLAVVIDHHPPRAVAGRATYHDVREDYGACSTMIVELMRAGGIEPDAKLATGLFYAIQSETQDLGREASTADIEASIYLYPLTDPAGLSRIRHAQVPRGLFQALHDSLERAWQREGAVCVPAGELAYPDIVAQLADFFMRVQGVDRVMAMGVHQGDILISVRADETAANAGVTVRSVVGDRGTAGGHGQMAGGRVSARGLSSDEIDAVLDELFERFCDLVGAGDAPRVPLLERTAESP